jgi:serine protease Do
MNRSLRHAAALAACVTTATWAQGVDLVPPEQLFERLAPSVWTVETFDARNQPLALGSAVVIGAGSLVTNCHVLARSSRVAISRENVSYGATLEHPDPERDLCILKVRNFSAPAVTVGNVENLKTGSRVYAIGSPRGLEQTISDGLLSGVRKSTSGDFTALQVTVPISKGSSGGGLFDAHGRLIGITTFQLRDGQNLNFALPVNWIAEVPARAQTALASMKASPPAAASAAAVVAGGGKQVYEYQLRDKLSGAVQTVVYRLDRMDGDKLVFNDGSRIESPGGGVVHIGSRIGGEFDLAMPPGGWISSEPKQGATWKIEFSGGVPGSYVGLNLRARAQGESTMRIKDRTLRVILVDFDGYAERIHSRASNPPGRYTAKAWYAPELGRIVRFEAQSRGGLASGQFHIDEQLQLVDIRTE